MPNMTMLPSELQELMADVANVKLQDVHLGRVLEKILTHLAHAHGIDPNPEESAPEPSPEGGAPDEEAPSDEDETVTVPVVKGKGR